MEKTNVTGYEEDNILKLLKEAQTGDEKSMLQLLEMFNPEMDRQARMLRMSKEDALQSLKLELIVFIKNFKRYSEDEHNIGNLD